MVDRHIGYCRTGTSNTSVINSRDLGAGGAVRGIVVIIVVSSVRSMQGHMPKIVSRSRLIPHERMVASITLRDDKKSNLPHGIGRNIQGNLEVISIKINTWVKI